MYDGLNGMQIVEKDSALIGWRETQILIHANHSDMVKFSNAAENDYKQIKYVIREIITDNIERGRGNGNGTMKTLALADGQVTAGPAA